MRKQNGITMLSLILYIIVMLIVLSIMSSVISNFYDNINGFNADVDKIMALNKFNMYFLKEVKLYDNEVDDIGYDYDEKNEYIVFTSGNSFLFNSETKCIYYNNLKICDNIENIEFSYEKAINETNIEVDDKSIINVTLNIKDFSKTIKYKLENVY